MNATAKRVLARDILSEDELARVRRRSDWRGVWLIAHCWGVIGLAMALFALWPNPLTFLLSVAIIGARQLGLSILMHDAAHGLLVVNGRLNLILSQGLCAWPTFADTVQYRTYHLKHHARTQQPDDPDLVLSAPFPITRKSLRRKLLRDITGITAYRQRIAQFAAAFGPREDGWPERLKTFFRTLGGPLAANAVLFAGLALIGYWYLYPLLWLVPLFTVYQLVLRVRNIAEHAMVPDNDDPFRNARTTKAGFLERAFLAPYWVNYHVEHHLLMWVPCYNLPVFSRMLEDGPNAGRRETKPGYGAVLRMAASRPDSEDDRGSRVHTSRRRFKGLVMEDDAA